MSTKKTGGMIKALTWIVGLGGAALMIVGIVVYSFASVELSSQNITVASVNEGSDGVENGPNAGKAVRGPFTALSQINAITHHLHQASQVATGGTKDPVTGEVTGGNPNLTYGTAPSISLDGQGNCLATGALWTDPGGSGTVQCTKGAPPQVTGDINPASITSLRSTMTTGSFLISSLFVSVVAFGVAALMIGLGALFVVVSWISAVRSRTATQ